MSMPREAVEAAQRPDDLIAAILADHAEIKILFEETTSATTPDARDDAFRRLVRKLVVHETAEQEVVRPATRRADGGDDVADARLHEEQQGEELLAELERTGVEDPAFPGKLAKLRGEVLEHAEREEREEHPKLGTTLEQKRLEQLGAVFRVAEEAAPTHPHPHGPQSATGNLAVGPLVAIADRARDALRDALEKVGS